MGRKNVIVPYKIIDDGSMATDITSDVTGIQYMDNASIIVSWSGTAPVGELQVEVANVVKDDPDATIWSVLEFGTTIPVSGATGQHTLNMSNLTFSALRLKYLRTSGSGTMNAILTSKVVGA